MTVLASGSKGNSTIVSSTTTRILVDAGLSCRELMKRMKAAGEEPSALDAILITHEHQDHVQGMAVTARKLGIPVCYWVMGIPIVLGAIYYVLVQHRRLGAQTERPARSATEG